MRLGRVFGIVVSMYTLSNVVFNICKSFEMHMSIHVYYTLIYTESFFNFTISYILLAFFINIMIKSSIDRYFKLFDDTTQNTDNSVSKSKPNQIDINLVTSHKHGYFLFLKHLISEFSVENLLFLTEVELFKQKFKSKCIDNVTSNVRQNTCTNPHKQLTLSYGSILSSDFSKSEINILNTQSTLDSLNHHMNNNFDPIVTSTANFESRYDSNDHEYGYDSKQSNPIDVVATIDLPKRKYLPETPIMMQKTFTATVAMMIDVFVSKNATHEINVSSVHKKRFLQQPTVQSVLNDTLDQSLLQTKDLIIFDVYEKQAHKFIKDSFKRFSATSAFRKLSHRLHTKRNARRFSISSMSQ